MNAQRYLILDFETRSEADLKRCGAYEYAKHPTTKILCVAWRFGTREELKIQLRNRIPAKIFSPAFDWMSDTDVERLDDLLMDRSIKLIAHNALFEQVITRFILSKLFMNAQLGVIPHHRWICTAAMAASLALPRNLEGACQVLQLPVQKDKDGHRLMLKLSKPRKASKTNPKKWHNSIRDLKRIMQYCQTDVDAETMLFLTLPPLNPTEREVWLLDQKINFRGFLTDQDMVKKVLAMIAEETKILKDETWRLTGGVPRSTAQRDAVLKWLHDQGVFLPDLRAKTVNDALETGLATGKAKRLLEIRKSISRTSTAKYAAFEARSRTDGRVRDILVYHTASTGRWGGSGVQPQNFPRGTIEDTDLASSVLKSGDLEFVRLCYGVPMDVFSSCLRAVITAPTGRELFCADYAAIEARVLFWVARHDDGLKAFANDEPMYEKMAQVIFNLPSIEKVEKWMRQVGKQAFLGCGYGMGWKKFFATCLAYKIEGVTEEISQIAVKAYREHNHPVVKCWSNIEKAAIAAVKRKGTKFTINHTKWWVEPLPSGGQEFLWCELPSGRRLAYIHPEIRYAMTPWDEKRPVLYHGGVNPVTRKWEQSGTYGGRLVENVVQAISRDLMASAMLRIEEAGYDVILTVHDEILAECNKEAGSVKEFENLMAELPVWAKGLPVKVTGWKGERYKK